MTIFCVAQGISYCATHCAYDCKIASWRDSTKIKSSNYQILKSSNTETWNLKRAKPMKPETAQRETAKPSNAIGIETFKPSSLLAC